MSIILFFVILAVLVLVHEFGHFFAAKRFGVRVDEFGLGFPPKLFGKKVGETVYSVNAIPFGGFVRIFGETPDEDSVSGADSKRSFVNIARWKQAVILASGVAMNVVFAWILFSVGYLSGMTTIVSEADAKYVEDSHVAIIGVLPGSPAERAGIMPGDRLAAYAAGGATTTISSVEEVQDAIRGSKGKPVAFEVLRDGEAVALETVPELNEIAEAYVIGISMDLAGTVKLPFHLAFWEGAKLTGDMFVGIAVNLYTLLHDALSGNPDFSQVSGPVGIARLVGDAQSLGAIYLLSFTAFISLNLAVLNLIPFPALDGGRILFVAIEAVRRKAIKPSVANAVNAVGFGLLILFMVFVTYRDIAKLLG